jgi:rubrerythrin
MRSRLLAIAGLGLILVAVGGCGGPSGHGAETDPEKGSDAAALNAGLAQELTALDLYAMASRLLDPAGRPLARRLRSQEQEYVDAITKALRGLGADVEAEAEPLQGPPPGRRELLERALRLEGDALAYYVESSPHLDTAAPRTLAAALAAGHAQHMVVLRQAMGEGVVASIPKGFDTAGEE